MYQLSISQIHFKSLVQTQLMQISFQCADKREPLRIVTTQKIIKYSPSWTSQFDIGRFLQIFIEIQDEETGFIKVIGLAKIELNDIMGKEGIYKIDLEQGNQVSIFLKCQNLIESSRNSVQMQSQISWTKSLRTEPIVQKRQGSPQPCQTKVRQEVKKVNLQDLQQVKNIQLPTQSMPNLSDSRISLQRGRESYNSNFTYAGYSITNKCSQYQQTENLDSTIKFKQMIKELSLLLNVPQDCDSIVYAVQKVLQNFRQQSEQLIKIQCDHQILKTEYQTLHHLKNQIETNQEDFKMQIKQKLKNYKTLFEENVQLKMTLKEDLNKIVELNLKIKELKKDDTILTEINSLNQQIKYINQSVQQNQQDFAILVEEINLINE
ncbi:unnamed protein product [Paramecium sonneborni]|uniref:Uncharacterized protein n=1 Tax=Paramecium sonneborni TaxID=65129 RepID=A0A8S1JTM1_9CILI|nr:unnamed protein product [Paramecium sonneborni]